MTTGIVVGNPKRASRTFDTARAVITDLTGAAPDFAIDLTELGARLLDWADADATAAVEQVKAASLVVIASPTYKGAYTGLLKLFLDRFAAGSLASVTAVPLMLGGDLRHSLAPEVFLKPVLAELGASTPTPALFLLDSERTESDTYRDWLTAAARRIRREERQESQT
jgi:FMN reductase